MRVAMVLGRSTGGIGTHVVDLVAGLRELGEQVEVVTDSLTAERFGLAQAHLWWPGGGVATTVRRLRSLRTLLAEVDVAHAHGHQAGLVVVLASVGLGTRRPGIVVSQHNAVLGARGVRGLVARLAQRVTARRADLVTGASSDLVDRARDLGARTATLAEVPSPRVPGLLRQPPLGAHERSAAATVLLASVGVDPSGPVVLTISRVAPQKDLPTLVAAAAELGEAATWVVVGDGDPALLERLRRQAADRGAPVHFVGAVPDPEPWLRAAEVFVLTSTWEARALVVQEAMAAGTPVVATDAGGLHDLVDGAGRLVAPGEPAGYAAAVRELLADPADRERASTAGRDRAASWADSGSSARRWRQWYSALPQMT